MADVYSIEAVLNGTVFIHPDRGRESKLLAQLGRVEGVRKGVMHFPTLVVPKRIAPPAGRGVALGQQERDDGPQVVGAWVMARTMLGTLGGQLYLLHPGADFIEGLSSSAHRCQAGTWPRIPRPSQSGRFLVGAG